MLPKSLLTTLLSLQTAFICVSCGFVQKQGLTFPNGFDAELHRDAVKKIFVDSYNAYHDFAWGHDDLSPLSQGFSDGRNGWGASIVDAMSTMHIMGLDILFQEAVNYSATIDFSKSKTSDTVSVFETTIRYVGGLLSAYELSDRQYSILRDKAREVADKLKVAWVGTNKIPYSHIDFSNNNPTVVVSNIAEAGTLILEWATLSKYTGDESYRQLAEEAMRHIIDISKPLPGLPAQGIDPSTGEPVGGYVTWGGGSDSYFEYLIKYARLNNTMDQTFADSWNTAVDSSITTLLKTSTVGNHVYLADYDDSKKIRHVSSHLACFHGGNWLFGGKLLNNETIVNYGLQLVDACWNTYAGTTTGIGPEVFAFESKDGDYTGHDKPTPEQKAFYEIHGFYITAADYILRPEVLESNFYAWRVTGDSKYLLRAASAVESFNKYLRTETGYAGLWNVNDVNSDKIDDTESFWFAEVLKYLYLTFDNPDTISLDQYVFNTEAHPFKIPATKTVSYGSGKLPQPESQKPFKTTSGLLPAISASRLLPPLLDLLKIIPQGAHLV